MYGSHNDYSGGKAGDKVANKITRAAAGRPTVFCDELCKEILERISEGEDIVAICKDPSMPARSQIYAWLDRYPEFRMGYARAKEGLADHCVHQIYSIAKKSAEEIDKGDAIKLRALSWLASRYSPRQYSERMAAAADAQLSVQINNNSASFSLSHMSDDEKIELRRLLEKARNPVGLIEGD